MRVIPHFSALTPGFSRELTLQGASEAKRYLIRSYIAAWDFDEGWYLGNHPDLRAAIPSDAFADGWQHFVEVGYFEDRIPVTPWIDAEWYMHRYEDVAAAILDGTFASAREHYLALGRFEGRLPYAPQVDVDWYAKRCLDRAGAKSADAGTCIEHFIRIG